MPSIKAKRWEVAVVRGKATAKKVAICAAAIVLTPILLIGWFELAPLLKLMGTVNKDTNRPS